MISVTQVKDSGENYPITCLGKYDNQDGKKITIKDTFNFEGIIQHKLNLLLPPAVQLLITMRSTGPAGQQCQCVPELMERTVDRDREPESRRGNVAETEEDNSAR